MTELSVKEIKKILEETKELGGEKIDITGGEPTLRQDLNEIIKIAKSLDYKVELVTNGSLLNKNKLRELQEIGLDSIAISLDGPDYESYNKIRKVDKKTYSRVIKTIKEALELGIYTKINTVAFDSNLKNLEKITEFCIKNRINEHGIYYFTPIGRGYNGKQKAIEPIKWLKFIRRKLLKYHNQIKLSIEVPIIEKDFPKTEIDCILKEDPYHLQILPDGRVYPCVILDYYNKPIGDLKKTSVKEIWDNKKLWDACLKDICSDIFEKNCGFCVNFSNFNFKKYKKDYKFVCPLRKFLVQDLK